MEINQNTCICLLIKLCPSLQTPGSEYKYKQYMINTVVNGKQYMINTVVNGKQYMINTVVHGKQYMINTVVNGKPYMINTEVTNSLTRQTVHD